MFNSFNFRINTFYTTKFCHCKLKSSKMNLIKFILTLLVFVAFAKFSSSSAFKPAVKLPPDFLDEGVEEDPIVEEHLVMTEVKHIADEQGTSNKMRVDSRQEIKSSAFT